MRWMEKSRDMDRKREKEKSNTDGISSFEARAGFQPRDDLSIKTCGIKCQTELFRDIQELQLNLRAQFLLHKHTNTRANNRSVTTDHVNGVKPFEGMFQVQHKFSFIDTICGIMWIITENHFNTFFKQKSHYFMW